PVVLHAELLPLGRAGVVSEIVEDGGFDVGDFRNPAEPNVVAPVAVFLVDDLPRDGRVGLDLRGEGVAQHAVQLAGDSRSAAAVEAFPDVRDVDDDFAEGRATTGFPHLAGFALLRLAVSLV